MAKNSAHGLPMMDVDLMIIDRNRFTLSLIRSCAFNCGIRRVRAFDNVNDALESMLVDAPNIILSEWGLDAMTGCQLLRLVRHQSMKPLCFVPFGLLTTHPTRQLVQHAHNAGVHFVLSKPISPAALSVRLEWLIRDEQEFVFDSSGNCLIKGRRFFQSTQATKLTAIQRIQLRKAITSKKNSEVHKVIDDLFQSPQGNMHLRSSDEVAADHATRQLIKSAQDWSRAPTAKSGSEDELQAARYA